MGLGVCFHPFFTPSAGWPRTPSDRAANGPHAPASGGTPLRSAAPCCSAFWRGLLRLARSGLLGQQAPERRRFGAVVLGQTARQITASGRRQPERPNPRAQVGMRHARVRQQARYAPLGVERPTSRNLGIDGTRRRGGDGIAFQCDGRRRGHRRPCRSETPPLA